MERMKVMACCSGVVVKSDSVLSKLGNGDGVFCVPLVVGEDVGF